ncbi:hypothetical protein SDRG_14499 [Saprolegnia diclina VS20]|uniref:Uncharacterized protein n=1 Tax=Saprolegnia diclina (strain VS20) TaxID=1156394 RepID=T0Q2W7_SAPDV|nr:hypothetical protein SDRG_14499 [Saprolegnia diclina VS20]EQC27750.1 hypothetical protein SDRG_14499 [Saprolegnia diclina VS20]|eukprot:XP_008618855.1 hypothetical protein SDRG_14499 [Saprolegnia diclina VS20]
MPKRLARGPDDSVFAPEIIETIARMIPCPASFRRFVRLLQSCAKTPALASLARLFCEPSIEIAWPSIVVHSPDLSSAAFKDLGAISTLAPKSVIISYAIKKRQDWEVVEGIASRITTLEINFERMTTDPGCCCDILDADTWAYYRTALASCQRLETLALIDSTGDMRALTTDFLDLPRLTSLTLASRGCNASTASPDMLTHLVTWVSTKPVTHLALQREVFGLRPNEPSMIALADAIASSTSLTFLRLHDVPLFSTHFLYGRRLPVHLKSLVWDPFQYGAWNNVQGWRNLASAIRHGPQLDHLYCKRSENFVGQDVAVLAKVQGLTSFQTSEFGDDPDRATSLRLLKLLGCMVYLKHLGLVAVCVDADIHRRIISVLGNMRALETLALDVAGVAPDEYRQLLMVISLSPRLREVKLSAFEVPTDVVLATLPLLNVATEGLLTMYWEGVLCKSELPYFVEAAKKLRNRSFALMPHPSRSARSSRRCAKLIADQAALLDVPELVQTIAAFVACPTSFLKLVAALPLSALSPPLLGVLALYDHAAVSSGAVAVDWPLVIVREPASAATLVCLRSVRELLPSVRLGYPLQEPQDVVDLHDVLYDLVVSLTLHVGAPMSISDAAACKRVMERCHRLSELTVLNTAVADEGDANWVGALLPAMPLRAFIYHGDVHSPLDASFVRSLLYYLDDDRGCTTLKLHRTDVDVAGDTTLLPALCAAIVRCASLTTLSLNGVPFLHGPFLRQQRLPPNVSHFEFDKHGLVRQLPNDTADLGVLVASGQHLQHVACDALSVAEPGVAHRLRQLTSFEYTCRPYIGSRLLLLLLPHLVSVRTLALGLITGPSYLSSEKVQFVACVLPTACKRLRHLDLSNCELSFRAMAVVLAALPKCRRLESLALDGSALDVAHVQGLLPLLGLTKTTLTTVRLNTLGWPLHDRLLLLRALAVAEPGVGAVASCFSSADRTACVACIQELGLTPTKDAKQCVVYV